MLNTVIDVPAGYCQLIYRCPKSANYGWQYHDAVPEDGLLPVRDENGDFRCRRCGQRLFVDTVHKVPYTMQLIVLEEEF